MAKGITKVAQRLQSNLKNVEKDILKIVKKHEKLMKDLLIAQMDRGIKGDGTEIGRYAPGKYREEKIASTGSDLINLEKTGEFKSEVFIDADSLPVVASSHDPKTSLLVENYGEDIFKFTEENKKHVFELLQKEIKEHFRKILDV